MLEIIAEKQPNGEFSGISIAQNNQKILLSAEESMTLVNVLMGREGVITVRKLGEYQPEKIILCSCGGEKFHCEVEDFPSLKDFDKSN